MRVRQGTSDSAGIWFHQRTMDADRAFVGMADDSNVGFYGTGVGWGLRVNTDTGEVDFHGDFGTPNGPANLALWGSRIGDVGNGVLYLHSGGSVVAVDKDRLGVGTTSPAGRIGVTTGGNEPALHATGHYTGVYGYGSNTGVTAVGDITGIWAVSNSTAGLFNGAVHVNGTISKSGGGFRIDHPLDPANQYLTHSFVESPEMLNLYNGTAVTGADGEAVVELPDWFAALNRDFCYQLTPIGDTALLAVVDEVRDNRFTIRSDRPGVRVCWQVTGVRQDPWANANRLPVEEQKPEPERDRYLHPELHGLPADRHVWAERLAELGVAL
jgi:hypothetical protein